MARPVISTREKELVMDCLDTGWISSKGKYIELFEQALADWCGCPFAVATSNGTTALHLALAALGVGPGDEVIVPSLTFIATANAVTYTGARAVFADSDLDTWNMDPGRLEELITPATRGIIPVHIYGHPADMQAIMDIARAHGLWVLEDVAEAPGSQVLVDGQWHQAGSVGVAGCFSFFGNKIITTGEGGMVTTGDADLAARLRMLRDHGMDPARPYWHPVLGYNYRMTNMQAAVGLAQMERFQDILRRKQEIDRTYREGLGGIKGITLPPSRQWARPVCWLFSVLVEPSFGMSRDDLRAFLAERGVETRPFFTPVHEQPPYGRPERLEVASRLAAYGLNLPSGPEISLAEIKEVYLAVAEAAPP